MGIHGDSGGYMGLQGITGGYKGLRKPLFLARTSLDTFSWYILQKNLKLKKSPRFDENHGLTSLQKF